MENLIRLWPLVTPIVFLIVWIIRLESKIIYMAKDHEQSQVREAKVWTKIDIMQSTMTSILQALAKIEGKLEYREG